MHGLIAYQLPQAATLVLHIGTLAPPVACSFASSELAIEVLCLPVILMHLSSYGSASCQLNRQLIPRCKLEDHGRTTLYRWIVPSQPFAPLSTATSQKYMLKADPTVPRL